MLERAGASLTEIDSAAELDGTAQISDLAIAIVDVGSGSDGLTLISRLRAQASSRPAILAIAGEAGLAELSQRAGADEVLVEPVAMTTLFDAIARYLPAS